MKISTKILTALFLLFGMMHANAQSVIFGGPLSPCTGSILTMQFGLLAPIPGASNYSWTITGPSNPTYSMVTANGSVITSSMPLGTYTVTLYPYAPGNILINNAIVSNTFNVGAPVNVVVSSTSPTNICIGSSITLYAFGAANYVWSTGATGSSIAVTPTANTCYSVSGTCGTGPASHCVVLMPNPFVSLATSNSVVCAGSSVIITAAGAATYTWANGPNTNSISVMPNTLSIYTVSSTNINGCSSTSTISVAVSTLCSDVWPGDANSDGLVGTGDVFEIGVQFASTGAARTPGGNTYVSQYATNWVGLGTNGKNKVHADCNGDGTVNFADTVAITNNFGIPHAFKPSPSATSDIYLVNNQAAVYPGVWNTVDIMLGDATSANVQLYGLSFDVDFESAKIDPNSVSVRFTPSFIKGTNSTIDFRKLFFSAGKLSAVCVRTDQAQVSGKGKIGELKFKVAANVSDTQTLTFGLSNVVKVNAAGVQSTLAGTIAVLPVSKNLVGLTDQAQLLEFAIYPNPSNNQITFSMSGNESAQYSISDVSGRVIRTGAIKNSQSVDVSALSNGIYMITLETANGSTQKKLVIEH